MTETRKQMYKILDEYMDKTLSFWCIIQTEDWHSDKYWKPITYFRYNIFDVDIHARELENDENDDYKIIGHYEIWAVLRYLEDLVDWRSWDYAGELIYESGSIRYLPEFVPHDWDSKDFISRGWVKEFFIDLKPLHLWTTEEEQNFINITKELWRNKG